MVKEGERMPKTVDNEATITWKVKKSDYDFIFELRSTQALRIRKLHKTCVSVTRFMAKS